ncbi:N-acetyltransferase GCN5 [Salinarchaeum sp. Harcht-Bsk1]|uniref:arsenic resistance N-acetyltransferase ArsN2 n=1 Tax=Salinarchaeum sp. Harcht-Bsk1 TaxID=1333523 RepID=UPI0003423DC4|nr:arsenic resistance N-acetyltransferase ArsN2 [Salinarchaeum sp. Harcht-Bsk1]AGN00445.1 N-acetyltransferase GCN5 [Salinarchaeum sp. Harcht-Bsk1]
MTAVDVRLEPATDDEALAYVEGLLAENDLPTSDVQEKQDCFSVAYADGDRVGIGGVERYGPNGLLRSVVVAATARGRGVGTALCDELEAQAREAGVERLYLLTTTAAEFFAARGYETIERSDARAAIRDSAEFAELCPDAATCMETVLGSGTAVDDRAG